MEGGTYEHRQYACSANEYFLVIVGLTAFNKSYFSAVMTDLANGKGLLWVTGLITFVMGTVIVALHNVWSVDWRVIVTLLGWLTVIGARPCASLAADPPAVPASRSGPFGRVPDAVRTTWR
jgi:hypothetical protein